MPFFENTRKPEGFGGKLMVAMMNLGHSPVARWGLQFLDAAPDARVLDCGCGGGANMKRLLKKCPQGIVKGIDYSPDVYKRQTVVWAYRTALASRLLLTCETNALSRGNCELGI